MSDESDNLVLRHLREMRAETKEGLSELRTEMNEGFVKVTASVADVRGVVVKTSSDVVALAGRLDEVDHDIRLADRLAGIEKRLTDLERRGS